MKEEKMLKSLFNDKSQYLARVEHDYAMRGEIEDIGRIATNAQQEFRGERSAAKRQRRRREDRLVRMTRDFYYNMDNWSMADFKTNGTIYRGWLNEQAELAYESGNTQKGNTLSETAHEFFIKEQEILGNDELNEEQKKVALKELWKDQDQELIEEFVAEFDGKTSDFAKDKLMEIEREGLKDPNIEEKSSNTQTSSELVLSGFKLG